MEKNVGQNSEIIEELIDSISVKEKMLENKESIKVIEQIIEIICNCYKNGGKVIFMGNGGSAADSQHLACEFVSRFKKERTALPSIALSVNTSILTAVGNDYGFDHVFERQIEAWAKKEDIVVGISTSGNSVNVELALRKAKEIGSRIVAFTGEKGGKISETADITFKAPSSDTPRIQEAHITVGHIICSLVEKRLFS